MLLKKLKLTNYRNYGDLNLDFSQMKVIIVGQNAQGKSNILEAINLLATSESDKAEKDSDLIKWNESYALAYALVDTKEGSNEIILQINPNGRRRLKVNNVFKKSPQADLLGNLFAVMFSCEDLYLIKGSPSYRRKWLDSVLYQLDLSYHKLLQKYQKNISQKNALLKRAIEIGMSKKELKEQVSLWNEQIVEFGSEIIFKRLNFFREIRPIASKFLFDISRKVEELELVYKDTINSELRPQSPDQGEIKEAFSKSINNSFEAEFARSQSLIGPHRDDVSFLINQKEAKSFASQGQQRSIVLSVKLAEINIFEKLKNEIPILLLDDVFAELDENRQDFLLHNLPESIQIFLTTTHISAVQKDFLKGAHILEINAGGILQGTASTL